MPDEGGDLGPIEAKEAVDDHAKQYFEGYYGDYGKALVKEKGDKKRENKPKEEPKEAVEEVSEPNEAADAELVEEQVEDEEERKEAQALPEQAPAAPAPGAPKPAPAAPAAPSAPKPAPAAPGAPAPGAPKPGDGDEGLLAIGLTQEEVQQIPPQVKQKLLQAISPKKEEPAAPGAPKPAPAAPGAPAPGPEAPKTAPVQPKSPVAAHRERRRQEAQMPIEEPAPEAAPPAPVPEAAPTAPAPGAQAPEAAPLAPEEAVSRDQQAWKIYNEVLKSEVQVVSDVQVEVEKANMLRKRLMDELGMSADEFVTEILGASTSTSLSSLFK